MIYRLTVHKIDHSCLFELTWGQSQRLTASLPYPPALTTLYRAWQRAYLTYYQQGLRGRPGAVGQVSAMAKLDWHSQVVQAEARLLSEFHRWLRHEALFELRAELMRQAPSAAAALETRELFLACSTLELARLPWETWEVGADLGQPGPIQIVRSPATIRSPTANQQPMGRGKPRVLAILGDETGLEFAGDRAALKAQTQRLAVHYLGWQPQEDAAALKQRICQTVADARGWDVLLFAGHSNEEQLLAGQIAIAPHTFISIKELTPYLQQAQRRGLQFALFNSCNGLDIANGLISLGLNQVAIMREPIHNQVAHAFLLQFLQRLAHYDDAQAALKGACQALKLEQQLTYPSAYLVPSLFRHPDSRPYRIPQRGWWRRWQPRRREALGVAALALISLLPPVQDWLMNQRVRSQAIYRQLSGQLAAPARPPIVLVQIDDRTLQEWRIAEPLPIDRTLLAEIVTQLNQLQAPVVGIDYLLDRPLAADTQLRGALTQGITQGDRWFVFAAKRNLRGEWLMVHPDVASLNWSLAGDIWVPWWHIRPRGWSEKPLPFSYQLAIAHHLSQTPAGPTPDLASRQSLQTLIEDHWVATQQEPPLSPRVHLHPITNGSYWLYQRWLQPLLDFSIPPRQVYTAVPAWQLLQAPEQVLTTLGLDSLADRVVIVAAGGYDEAGSAAGGGDNWPTPPALAYWQDSATTSLTGGEAHAYMAHHVLTDHLVVPLPDLWLVLVAALVGKALTMAAARWPASLRWRLILGLASTGYGLLTLQLYISSTLLLPWLLPTVTVWFYLWPDWRNPHDKT